MELGDIANPWVAGAIVAVVVLAVLLGVMHVAVMHAVRPTLEDGEGATPDETALLTNRSLLKQMELYGRH
jgi:hypothetical protein